MYFKLFHALSSGLSGAGGRAEAVTATCTLQGTLERALPPGMLGP